MLSDQFLTSLLPAVIVPGIGEPSLSSRIAHFISQAELLFDNIFGSFDQLLNLIPEDSRVSFSNNRDLMIGNYALARAIPALNVTLHPNGLATVQTEALTPASAKRTEDLIISLDRSATEAFDSIIGILENTTWFSSSKAARYICSTIFHTSLSIASRLNTQRSVNAYLQAISHIGIIESYLADNYLSIPLIDRLRIATPEDLSSDFNTRSLLSRLHDLIVILYDIPIDQLKEQTARSITLGSIMDLLKKYPGSFPEWHNSQISKRFTSPVFFRNQRHSGGYFF